MTPTQWIIGALFLAWVFFIGWRLVHRDKR